MFCHLLLLLLLLLKQQQKYIKIERKSNARGAEAAIHAVRRYTENLQKDYIIVKLDFINAFNTSRRYMMLEAIRRELPELYNFAHATYNGASVL